MWGGDLIDEKEVYVVLTKGVSLARPFLLVYMYIIITLSYMLFIIFIDILYLLTKGVSLARPFLWTSGLQMRTRALMNQFETCRIAYTRVSVECLCA